MEDLRRARRRLGGFLLRHGRVHTGRSNWTKAHRAWLARQRFDHAAQQIVFQDYLEAIADAATRHDRLVGQIEALLPSGSLAPVVEAFQLMRGVALIGAVTAVAEIGDFTRFDSPRQLMAYLGLVPCEASSGHKVGRGGITKAGNTRVRRVLVERAWSSRLPARVAEKDAARWDAAPKAVREIAWKAQTRLCPRYRRLIAKGKSKNVVTVAIAREMVAFPWAIAQQVAPPGTPSGTPSETA
jgi:transposase